MGMILQLRFMDAEEMPQLISGHITPIEFLFPEDESDAAHKNGKILDVDKAWHAIHFLLAKEPWGGAFPQAFILSGEEIGEDEGYGPARILNPLQVSKIAKYLRSLPANFVEDNFSFAELRDNGIYPDIWDREEPEDTQYVSENFLLLKKFIQQASDQKMGVVLALV